MRTVFIDLTKDGHCRRDGIDVGYTGEHNATELVVAVPPSMADESEYLTAVFLSNGKIIRSEKITETQEEGKPYLTGNQVHILLSKRLTQSPTLGLQIEGYRKNEHGTAVLLGKSQFITSLHFHLSPQGEQDAAGGVDPDELSDLMDWWRNRESGEETDKPSGIRKAERLEDLPRDAEAGDLAYVLNDSGDLLLDTPVTERYYAGFRFKDDLDRDILLSLPSMDFEEADFPVKRFVGIDFRAGSREGLCFFIMLYYEPIGSIFAFSEFKCEEDLEDYMEPDKQNVPIYLYCCGDGDISAMFSGEDIDPASANVSRGWYKLTYEIVEYVIQGSHLEEREQIRLEPIERCDISGLNLLRNCCFKLDDSDFEPYLDDILPVFRECFDIYANEYRESGLYLFDGDHWLLQKNMPVLTAADRTWLPLTAEEGQLGIVRQDTWLLEDTRGYMYTGAMLDRLYINPVLGKSAWVCDYRISAKYITLDYQTWTVTYLENDVGLDLASNAKDGYVFLSISSTPWDAGRQHYLYARESGAVDLPADSQFGNPEPVTLYVSKGWNRVMAYSGGCDAWSIDPYTELPSIIFSNYGSQYQMEIVEFEGAVHEEPFITNTSFCHTDEGQGVWYFGGGRWRKVDA